MIPVYGHRSYEAVDEEKQKADSLCKHLTANFSCHPLSLELSQKFYTMIVRTHFVSQITWNNPEMIDKELFLDLFSLYILFSCIDEVTILEGIDCLKLHSLLVKMCN